MITSKKTKLLGLIVLQAAAFQFLLPTQAAAEPPLRDEVCLNGTWNLELEGIEKPAQVRVPGSFAGQNELWGKEHWDVWDYPDDWANRPVTYVRSIEVPENLGNRSGPRKITSRQADTRLGQPIMNGRISNALGKSDKVGIL